MNCGGLNFHFGAGRQAAEKIDHATPADQKTSAATLHALISERMTLLQLLLNEVNSSAEALKPITTKKGMAGHEKYWAGIKADDLPESSQDE